LSLQEEHYILMCHFPSVGRLGETWRCAIKTCTSLYRTFYLKIKILPGVPSL